jgi:transcriptional antiterminator RfaH
MSETGNIAAQPARWYVARSAVHQEKLVLASLRAERVDAYLAMTFKTNRKDELYALPLFPGFVFVRLAMDAAGWTKVFSARGVSAVLGCGGRPSPVSDRVVEWIRQTELEHFASHGLKAPDCRAFERGQLLRIRKGAFAEFEGVFVERLDRKRSAVLIRMFGADVVAEAETEHLDAA